MKPFSPSCERNQKPILDSLKKELPQQAEVLEIGSGTGQHAIFFARHMASWVWQTSDVISNHPGIHAWLNEAGLDNVKMPLHLDVCCDSWPDERFDAVFSANTAHIMSWEEVCCMIRGVANVLRSGGCFCLYGPFSENGSFNAESNRKFDAQLRSDSAHMGIRDILDLTAQAESSGMQIKNKIDMPANNYILVFEKHE